jgi:hypothetical protein
MDHDDNRKNRQAPQFQLLWSFLQGQVSGTDGSNAERTTDAILMIKLQGENETIARIPWNDPDMA